MYFKNFPKGQSVEIIKSSTLKFLTQSNLKVDEKEHVTSFIYKNPKIFKILNYKYTKNQSSLRLSIDNKNDFLNFKSFIKTNTNFLNYNLDKIIEEWKEKKLEVAIVGLGVGEQHLIGFQNSSFINNIYIFDKNKKKAIEIKKKYKNVIVCNSINEIYTNPKNRSSLHSFL